MAGYLRYDSYRPEHRVELSLEVKKFSPEWKSTLFTDGAQEVWIAKSQYMISDGLQGIDEPKPLTAYTVSVPEWLARKEGLI
ncbi:MAG: hypothetical protein ABFD81_14505 [Syntrophaceae bacterium]